MNSRRAAPPRTADYRLDPFDLRLFTAVLETGTITAAAGSMNLSLAAASERLKSLEHRVGVPLLERAGRGTAATDAGRALARHARRLLAEVESLHVALAAYGHGGRGTVRLLANTAAMAEALPPRLGAFLKRHRDIDLELQEMSSEAILDALRRGAADLGVVADHVDTTGLVARPWLADQLVAMLPAGAAVRRRRGVGFVELMAQPFIGLPAERGLSRFLLRQALRAGYVPHYRVRVSSFDAAAQLVTQGVGVSVMPRSSAERWLTAPARIVALTDAWATRRLMLCSTKATAGGTGAIRLLTDALLADVTQQPRPFRTTPQ